MHKKAIGTVFFILIVLGAGACTPMGAAVGAGATLGVASAKEGGIKTTTTDAAIRLQINDLWFKHDFEMYRRLDMTVKEGRVLITGKVPDPDQRVDAVRLAWQANGVRQVINEIRVEDSSSIRGWAQDTWITANLRSKIMLDKEVQSINYTIDTVNGTVYLMGIARDEAERQRVIDHARNQKYVENVVSYIRLKDETPAGLQTPTGARDENQ